MLYKLDYFLQGSHGRTNHERILESFSYLLVFFCSAERRGKRESELVFDLKCDKTIVNEKMEKYNRSDERSSGFHVAAPM